MTNVSQIEVLITRACNPTMGEPNYALHLEVADHINQKKANTYVITIYAIVLTAHHTCVLPPIAPQLSVRMLAHAKLR